MAFDKDKGHGTLIPPRGRAHFTQGGRFYDHTFVEVPDPDHPEGFKPEPPPAAPAAAKPAPVLSALEERERKVAERESDCNEREAEIDERSRDLTKREAALAEREANCDARAEALSKLEAIARPPAVSSVSGPVAATTTLLNGSAAPEPPEPPALPTADEINVMPWAEMRVLHKQQLGTQPPNLEEGRQNLIDHYAKLAA